MNEPLSFTEMIVRLALAAVGGALVGLERQIRDKPAGLRTNMLVGLGAAGFVLTAIATTQISAPDGRQLSFDPTRILQGIVGGIGFLGAGAILHSRGNVHGITTAAAMWVVAAVGAACGFGQFNLAAAMVAACLVALYPLGYLENRLERRSLQDKDKREATDR
jgi:putative Mg2+ transporter-C (MgtC) family protein